MLNWVVWAAGGLVMFSTAWVSAVTLFSVCLSGVCLCSDVLSFSEVWLLPSCPSAGGTGLAAAGMRAVQRDTLVRLDEWRQPGELDGRQRPKAVSSLLFHTAHALFCQFNDQSEGELELGAVSVWSCALFRLQPASQASLRHSLAVAMQDHKKEAQTRAERPV